MNRACLLLAAAAALSLFLAPTPAHAQMSQVRGMIVDEQGQPLPDVNVEIRYEGEGPKKVYNQKTNKKGGFVRVGLPPGPYKIYFTKEGYQKYGIDTYLSLGGLSEMCSNTPVPGEPCKDLVLKKQTVTTTVQGAPGAVGGAAGGAADAAAAKAASEEAAKLGATYQQAVEAIKLQQWDTAETALKEVLTKVPDQPVVLFNLGHVHRQKKDFASAEARFKRVTELEPTKPDAYIALASLYEEQGRGPEAVDLLVKASPGFEQDAKFQTALGATAMNSGREKDAEAAFVKAEALDPSNVEIEYYLASLALNRNETADAIAHLQKYIAEAPAASPNVETAKALVAALQAKKK